MSKIHGTVTSVTPLTDRITEFRIARTDGAALPAWHAGAHVLVDLPDGDTRAYSLIDFDAPGADPTDYRIAVQREPEGKGGSLHMHGLAAGSALSFSAPRNSFPLQDGAPALLIAGGIGITPMISMAATLKNAGQQFDLHYAGRTKGMMAYAEKLRDHFGDPVHLHADDDPATALDLDALLGTVAPDAHLYVCGPKGLITATQQRAGLAGINAERIHVELFDAPQEQQGDTAFEVEINSGDVFTVAPGQSIIEALEEAGVDVMYDCKRGDCGICQCDVISGTPDHRDVVLSEAERAAGKVMQICVSRSKSPRLVLDI